MNDADIRLLLVDDEPMARRKIRSFPLEKRGFRIVGEAENGEQAWRMIRELSPDIVVADIGMPVLGGLELLERTGTLAAPPKMIMLTCYEEFEKAQAALRFGAFDYLTKLLLAEEEFIGCLCRASGQLQQEREQRRTAERQLLREAVLSGGGAEGHLEQPCAGGFAARVYQLALFRSDPQSDAAVSETLAACEEADESFGTLTVQLEQGLWAMRLSSEEGDMELVSRASACLLRAGEALRRADTAAVLAVSAPYHRYDRLRHAVQECRELLDRAFYAPLCVPVSAASGLQTGEFPEERFLEAHRECREASEREDPVAASDVLLRWIAEAEETRPDLHKLRHMADSLSACLSAGWLQTGEGEGLAPLGLRIGRAVHITEARLAAEEAAWALRRLPGARTLRREIREALKLIMKHYKEELDASSAARLVNLSPSWFGTLFRTETGRSFADYLQDYRLDRARELLLRTDLKIYEVAARAGIPNSRYFSRLFADRYRMSPQEFRTKMRSDRQQASSHPAGKE